MNRPTYDPQAWPFVRTCQDCNHKQIMRDPSTLKGDAWREAKCRKCGSQGSLDYGSNQPWTDQQKAEYDAFEAWENAQPEEYWK